MYLYRINEQIVTLTEKQLNDLVKTKNINKNDVVRESEDLTELFNKSVEDLLKEKESHLIWD